MRVICPFVVGGLSSVLSRVGTDGIVCSISARTEPDPPNGKIRYLNSGRASLLIRLHPADRTSCWLFYFHQHDSVKVFSGMV